jgi:hypothetical protein
MIYIYLISKLYYLFCFFIHQTFLSEDKYYVINYVMLFVQWLTAQFCVVDRQHRYILSHFQFIFVCASTYSQAELAFA